MTARTDSPPLLATKFRLPRPRPTAVARPRLIEQLLRGLQMRLTLIAAPAGFGKSTLLAQALAAAQQRPSTAATQIAFVALDANDNDLARFWYYVCAALERAAEGLGASALAMLRAAPNNTDAVLAEVINALAEYPDETVLVLDDYHTLTHPDIHASIAALLDHAPPQFHLLIASRIDPLLPLARWRARGELLEIRANDLRFTADEAVAFLGETMGLSLDSQAVATLEARTEGWAAGLQLAALSLQGQRDVQGFIANFSGSHRHIVDYLIEEVLDRQPAPIRSFLLQTAILERMNAALCDALIERDGHDTPRATHILAELERQNLFLISLDDERQWYRYHHLFADLLRHHLKQEYPERIATLHRRAALWHEQQGNITDAIEHAMQSKDEPLVVRLLETHATQLAAHGQTQTLQRWLDHLPRATILKRTKLSLLQAQVLLLNRQISAIEPFVQAAEANLADDQSDDSAGVCGVLLTMRAHLAIEQGAFAEALTLARQAQAMLGEQLQWARSDNGLVLGYALMVLGHTDEALQVHAENARRSRMAGNVVSALFSATEVIKLRMLQGNLAAARRSAEEALAWATEEGWQHLPPASALHIWHGNVLIEQGEFQAANEALQQAIHLTQHGPAITAARAQTFLARVQHILGDRQGVVAALDTVERIVGNWGPGGERSFFAAWNARLRLLSGDQAAAQQWAKQRQPWRADEAASYFREIELLTLALVAVLSDETSQAHLATTLAMLEWLRNHAEAAGRTAIVIETLILEALAHRRDEEQAHRQLDAALSHALHTRAIGTFVEFGAPMQALLSQHSQRRSTKPAVKAYCQQVLAAFPSAPRSAEPAPALTLTPSAQHQHDALTAREREVLRLYAAGLSSPEIAQHFVVSINTIKTQLKSIYTKLDVHSRSEAVARAKELGLTR